MAANIYPIYEAMLRVLNTPILSLVSSLIIFPCMNFCEMSAVPDPSANRLSSTSTGLYSDSYESWGTRI